VLEATRGADHAIWVVAFLLYAIDAARVLAPREIMLVEASHGRLDAHFGGSPIGGAGRILAVAPLLLPHRGVFVAPWGQARKESAGLAETLRSLQELRRALLVVRLFAAEAFGTLFVLGPVLTLVLGPDAAVLYTAIVIYPTVVVAIAALWWQRRDLSLTNERCARLSLEILVCPAFLPNLARKITTAQPLPPRRWRTDPPGRGHPGSERGGAHAAGEPDRGPPRRHPARRLHARAPPLVSRGAQDHAVT